MSFQMQGVKLDVEPTDAVVKADRILTLFMINTIADNARKFTPEGGKVTISAKFLTSWKSASQIPERVWTRSSWRMSSTGPIRAVTASDCSTARAS